MSFSQSRTNRGLLLLQRLLLGLSVWPLLGANGGVAERRMGDLSVQELISVLEETEHPLSVVHRLRRLNDPRALPVMKRRFEDAGLDAMTRGALAASIVALGEPDARYFRFVEKRASNLLEERAPFPWEFDASGLMREEFASSFLSWCRERKLDPAEQSRIALYADANAFLLLALTNDRRALPILRLGLRSPNWMIVAQSGKALAYLGDEPSADAVIAAARRAPREAAAYVAEALVFFETDEAREAAQALLPNERTFQTFTALAEEHGRRGALGGL